jgi:hypothetical protein
MGRGAQDARSLPEYKDSAAGYHSEFGDKSEFRNGYREGFLSGYGDSIHDRSFRAISAAKITAADLGPDSSHRRAFDAGFAAGYGSLRPQPIMRKAKSGQECSAEGLDPAGANAAYCEGFRHGRKFAFFAAPLEDSEPGFETAAKR